MCGRYGRRADKEQIAGVVHAGATTSSTSNLRPLLTLPRSPLRPAVRLDRTTSQRESAINALERRVLRSKIGKAGYSTINARAARRQILLNVLSGELNATAHSMLCIARQDPATRDLTLGAIRRALVELLVHFPVYRLYAGAAGQSAADERVIATALAGAMASCRRGDRELLETIARWLGADLPRAAPAGRRRQERLRARVRFQQLSAPTAAKSVEDTAFYRYGRLLSRNGVGSDPAEFACTLDEFHAACTARLQAFPRALLATATHDHKRGEDVRARLAVISEWPDAWAAFAMSIQAAQPANHVDPADRLMLLQMLVGAWPAVLDRNDEAGIVVFRDRIGGWQLKALREAKLRTDWSTPDPDYEAACRADLDLLLRPAQRVRPSRTSPSLDGARRYQCA